MGSQGVIECIERHFLEDMKASSAKCFCDPKFKIDVVRPMPVEWYHGPRHRIDVYSTPADFMKQLGIREAEWVMSTDIDVETATLILIEAPKDAVFTLLRP